MKNLLLLSLFCALLQAHALKIFAMQEGQYLRIKSYFAGGSACRECEVKFIKEGKVFFTTKTDENGTARVRLVQNEFEIIVDGSIGHQKSLNFKTDGNFTSPPEQNSEEFALKFALSLAAIFAIFGAIYRLKARR